MRRFVNVMAALSLMLLMTVLTGCGGLFMSMWEQESSNIVSVWEQEPFTGEDGVERACTLIFYDLKFGTSFPAVELIVKTDAWTETVTGYYDEEEDASAYGGPLNPEFNLDEIYKHPKLAADADKITGLHYGQITGDTLEFYHKGSPYFNVYTRK